MSGARGIVAGVALSAVSLALTLIGVELAFRTRWLAEPGFRSTAIDSRVTSDPTRPNFRQSGYELEAKGDRFRIVVVGDSFAWGDGVYSEDAFPSRLETRLNALSRGEIFDVVNWSRPGWNTVRQVQTMEWALPQLDPDILLLAFVLNDPEPLELARRDAMLASARRREPANGMSTWLFEHSRFYRWAWTRLENRRQHRALAEYYRRLFNGEHWQQCQQALRRLKRMARNQRVPLLLLVFPVFDGPMDDSYAYFDLHERIENAARALGIPLLDLLEVYRDVDPRRLSVTPFTDPHPNELAHRLAADAILDELVREELLPPIRYREYRRLRAQRTPGSEASSTE